MAVLTFLCLMITQDANRDITRQGIQGKFGLQRDTRMKLHSLIAALSVASLLFSANVLGDHPKHGKKYSQHKHSAHHHPSNKHGHKHKHRHEQPRQVVYVHTAPRRHGLPSIDSLRRQVYQNRHYIGRVERAPAHVVIVQGRPLPRGWGRPLHARQRQHVPHYQGYEWRQSGSDLVLIAATTGIVYALLDNVLN